MELGERLRQARLEAGLSQRQLCGEEITRNMLSQIEHGAARPSMKTLQYLASRLGKPVSYFLEETAVLSPNQTLMDTARSLFDSGDFLSAAQTLESFQEPDPVFQREKELLQSLSILAIARQALEENRNLYALQLLQSVNTDTAYCSACLHREKLLLLGHVPGQDVAHLLPSLDEELLLRAREALFSGDPLRASRLLDAAQDQSLPFWNLLRGEAHIALEAYQEAIPCLQKAEPSYPKETAPKLEHCYRELNDYKHAYEYACKQK